MQFISLPKVIGNKTLSSLPLKQPTMWSYKTSKNKGLSKYQLVGEMRGGGRGVVKVSNTRQGKDVQKVS